jgi:hypothetical protein
MRQDSIALRPEEELLTGEFVLAGNGIVADETCKRIEQLTSGVLKQVATDGSGWERLFQDPTDGRFWELYYPRGEMHGGGPPSLRYLTVAQASLKYTRS